MKIKKKTHSGASKRFKLLKSGLVKYSKTKRRHLLTRKTSKSKREMRRSAYILPVDIKHIRTIL